LPVTLLALLYGFLLIGLTESLFDGPRVTALFFLLLFAALYSVLTRDSIGANAANHGAGSAAPVSRGPGGDCVHQVDNASAYMVLVA